MPSPSHDRLNHLIRQAAQANHFTGDVPEQDDETTPPPRSRHGSADGGAGRNQPAKKPDANATINAAIRDAAAWGRRG